MTLNPFKIVFAIDKLLVKLESFLLMIALFTLMGFAFLQVVLRNASYIGLGDNMAITWADVFNRLLVLWIGIFAATVAAKENKHLSLEVLTKFLPDRVKPIVALFVNGFVIVVTAKLTVASYLFFNDQMEFEAADLLFEGVPKAYFSIIFPLGFALLTWRYFVKFLEEIYKFGGGDDAYPKCEDSPIELSVNIKIKD